MFNNKKFIYLLCMSFSLLINIKAQTFSKETFIIETTFGEIKLKLYEETPVHKANFKKLVLNRFFDSLLFHRVINQFMIQGGDQLSKYSNTGDSLGHGDIGYTLTSEINPKLIHKKGALCAAREGDDINPKFESSASQFYIVMGKSRTLEDLKKYEDRINKTHYNNCAREFIKSKQGRALKQQYNRLTNENKLDSAYLYNSLIESSTKIEYLRTSEYHFNQQQINLYTTIGGTPHLDNTYTVFGEVIEGIEIIDKIAGVSTDSRNRPIKDIRMRIYLLENK
jgi:cyclophilin family peptidyl-prolyl cis-trans isomerase